MCNLSLYVAASFRHLHAVHLLGGHLRRMGYHLYDWTEKGTPPDGLTAAERRAWMDTDRGGDIFAFCAHACREADMLLYIGTSGQDAGVEVGMAHAAGLPILGIRGPLETPGLMLHGAVTAWVDTMAHALAIMQAIADDTTTQNAPTARDALAVELRELVHAIRHSAPQDNTTRA